MMHFTPSQVFQLSDNVLAQEIDSESVLLDLNSEQYFGLNPVGTRVWQMLNERRSFGHMIEVLHSEYDVNREQLENDVGVLLECIVQAGLATKVTPDVE